jgi:hypothetical protein
VCRRSESCKEPEEYWLLRLDGVVICEGARRDKTRRYETEERSTVEERNILAVVVGAVESADVE